MSLHTITSSVKPYIIDIEGGYKSCSFDCRIYNEDVLLIGFSIYDESDDNSKIIPTIERLVTDHKFRYIYFHTYTYQKSIIDKIIDVIIKYQKCTTVIVERYEYNDKYETRDIIYYIHESKYTVKKLVDIDNQIKFNLLDFQP